MRKVAFVKSSSTTLKLMMYESREGIYLFGYDSLADVSCIWDEWYETIDDAEERAAEKFAIGLNDWFEILDPYSSCKHDLINPDSIANKGFKRSSFDGMTGIEKLQLMGLANEFEKGKFTDKAKAAQLLNVLSSMINQLNRFLICSLQ